MSTDERELFYQAVGTTARAFAFVQVSYWGSLVADGFGDVRTIPGDGRAVMLEVSDDLSGWTMVATLDDGRGARSRVGLQVEEVRQGLDKAARARGVSASFPIADPEGRPTGPECQDEWCTVPGDWRVLTRWTEGGPPVGSAVYCDRHAAERVALPSTLGLLRV